MKAEEIDTIEDLIAFLGRKKTDSLFLEYIIEILGKENQSRKEAEELIS